MEPQQAAARVTNGFLKDILSTSTYDSETQMKFMNEIQRNIEGRGSVVGSGLGFSLIHAFASCGPCSALELMIDKGADMEAKDSSGNTPLLLASRNEQPDVIKSLFESGANPKAINNNDETAISIASWTGNAKVVENILGRVGISAYHRTYFTPLRDPKTRMAETCIALIHLPSTVPAFRAEVVRFHRDGVEDRQAIQLTRQNAVEPMLAMAVLYDVEHMVNWLVDQLSMGAEGKFIWMRGNNRRVLFLNIILRNRKDPILEGLQSYIDIGSMLDGNATRPDAILLRMLNRFEWGI